MITGAKPEVSLGAQFLTEMNTEQGYMVGVVVSRDREMTWVETKSRKFSRVGAGELA